MEPPDYQARMFKLQRLEITGFKSFADHTEVVFTGDGITAVVGPNGCGKCVSGDTLVTLADGRDVPIRKLVEAALGDSPAVETLDDGSLTRHNPHGIRILSLNPATLRLEPRLVSAFIRRQATPYLLRIRTRAGREVTATPYHPLFTLDQGRLRTLKAEELKVGTRLALPRRLPVSGGETSLPPFEVLKQFQSDDKIFVPYSAPLHEWANNTRARSGTWAEWTRVAGVPHTQFKGLLDGQAIGTATLWKLADDAQLSPPLDGGLKSRGSGRLRIPSRFTPDMARFCSLLVAEGRNTSANQVWFVNSDRAFNDEFERLARNLFGVEVHRRHYKSCAEDSLIYSRTLGMALERLFNFPVNSSSAEKEVPHHLLSADPQTQWAFLSGLFEGDAYICAQPPTNGKCAHAYIEYATASQKLARQVVALLLRLGVFALLRPRERYAANTIKKTRRTYYTVLIYGTDQLRYIAQHLSFVGEKRHALQRLRELVPASNPNHDLIPGVTPLVKEAARRAGVSIKLNRRHHPKLAAYVEQRCDASRAGLLEVVGQIERLGAQPEMAREHLDRLTVLATSDIYWDEIVRIEQVAPPDAWVYDLSVAGTHNFVAGNIIVHNSNVADSIAWVLGEQRIKHLRGTEMKDVIFQGSRNRQPSGMAEVVLHMLRDEMIEHEPDVDDIDSALEEIDDHAVSVEEAVSSDSPAEVAPALAPPSEATGESDVDAQAVDSTHQVPAEPGTAISTPATTKPHGKRHWRPSRLALEFAPGEQVSITRRLYRSGESEYLLNNRPCRLRDIQDLFSGTGLSGAHYAIVEQGRIEQILSAKPMDRRTIIEEAAGITKFRVRQRAAEARLESARANLSRISDIVSEIERQVGSLRRQAAKARRYRVLREELRELLRRMYVAEEHSLAALLEETRVRLQEAGDRERLMVEQLSAHEEEARRATQEARAFEDKLAEARAVAAEAVLQRDRRMRERTYQEEQAAALAKRQIDVESEIRAVRARLADVEAECERLREEDADLRVASEESALSLQSAEEDYAGRLAEVSTAEAEIERARAELLTHTAVTERLMEIGRQLEATLERLALQAEGLAREGERAATVHAERIAEAELLREAIRVARERLVSLTAEREAAMQLVADARTLSSTADAESARLRDESSRTKHRLDTLTELDARRAHYSPAVQSLFKTGNGPADFHAIGTLADALHVEPQWERVVEGVFGPSLQAIIVPTPDDAERAAFWLRGHGSGRASFLVVGLHGASEEADHISLNGESATTTAFADGGEGFDEVRVGGLLGAPGELLTALHRTCPREMNARVAGSLDHAMAMSLASGDMYVTVDGDWVAGGQLVQAGERRGLEDGAGLLAFKRELRELEARSRELDAECASAEEAAREARLRLGEFEETVVLLNEAIGREEREAMARELNAAALAQDIERAERHVHVVADEAARLARERGELEQRRATALAEAEAAEAARLSVAADIASATTVLAIARREAEAENESLGKRRAAAAAAAERRRATAAELRRMEAERSDLDSRLGRHTREVTEIAERLQELRSSIDEINRSAESIEEERAQEEQEVAEAAARLGEARETADALAAQLTELNHRAAAARDARAALEVQRAEATARLSYLREACTAELNQSLEELSRERIDDEAFDLEAGRARVEELRARIESFGAVNMMALEELSEAEERLQFLTAQRQDITGGIASTEEALREIKRRSRDRFRHAFEQINRNFGDFFQQLFGGGRGEMGLIDADDVLESGIDIIAQPPGKRLQNVLLLSGGEKAMAALALVLGIFQYRPSPFCLLDEVDAPLDEANVGRFADKIAEMSTNTQFIVITHNKRTMEMARALYGVTMEEAGISKLVSVKFE